MAYNDLNRRRILLTTGLDRRSTTVYNFNNRAMLTDRPYYGQNPYHNLPLTSRYIMESASSNTPHVAIKRIVSSNAPGEYADRFHSRPSGRPHVVGFDGRVVTSRSGRHDNRGFNGFFPSMKLRVSTPTKCTTEASAGKSAKISKGNESPKSSRSKRKAPPPFILELAPERTSSSHSNNSAKTAPARVNSGRSAKTLSSQQTSSPTAHYTLRSPARTARSAYDHHPPVYPYIIEDPQKQVDDLAELPKPMMVISRDNPWVYRYKVKKSMNELSKILASKPPPVVQGAFLH